MEALDREAEHELVAADRRVGGDLLAHLVGGAAQHVAALDQAVEQLVRVVAGRRCRGATIGGVGHVMASGDFGIVSWYMFTIVTR